MSRAWLMWTDGRGSGNRHGRQAASADRLRAGTDGSGGGGQAEIGMSRQGRGLQGWAERRDGLYKVVLLRSTMLNSLFTFLIFAVLFVEWNRCVFCLVYFWGNHL